MTKQEYGLELLGGVLFFVFLIAMIGIFAPQFS